MMQLHNMKKPKSAPSSGSDRRDDSAPWSRRVDPLADAFRAGQEIYKTGLLSVVNGRRATLGKPPVSWPQVGSTPHTVVWQEGQARLLRYGAIAQNYGAVAQKGGADGGAPILMVCSLINRPYVLDLLPGRSVVERLRAAGRDVWLLDWGHPTDDDRASGIARYAFDLLPRAARAVAEASGAGAPHVLGYCMGGTLSLLSLGAGLLEAASLLALATPVQLHDSGLLSLWCRAPGFDADEIVRLYGNAPPHLLQPAFKMLDPVGLATKLVHLEEKLGDDDFVRFFLAMETWLEDSVAFPGRAFSDWVRLYREDTLSSGTFALDGVKIDLRTLRLPILSIVAEKDYITPLESSLAIERLVPNARHTVVKAPGGHIGLATSGQAHKTLWPDAARWWTGVDDEIMRLHKIVGSDFMQTHQTHGEPTKKKRSGKPQASGKRGR